MAYQALYRKWRSKTFDDVIGQTHITDTLKNQIKNNNLHHAYLFCGIRGTGKTSVAKVLSRAINCLNPQNSNPCNVCEVCRGINDGSIMDVIEMDAASNNGVDNIRQIREEAIYTAAATKYKVYIIDEVHMLSSGAFNALLKILEEPPEHVIFILATTEAHKILPTILSRCQRFDFKRISVKDIILRFKEVLVSEGIDFDQKSLELIARMADGSMRDGLSILERAASSAKMSVGIKAKIDYNDVLSLLGVHSFSAVFDMATAIACGNSNDVVEISNNLYTSGIDFGNFIEGMVSHLRDIMISTVVKNVYEQMDYSVEYIDELKKQSALFTKEKLSYGIEVLNQALSDAKWSKNGKVIYELGLLRATNPILDSRPASVLDRISKLEGGGVNVIFTPVYVGSNNNQIVKGETRSTDVSKNGDDSSSIENMLQENIASTIVDPTKKTDKKSAEKNGEIKPLLMAQKPIPTANIDWDLLRKKVLDMGKFSLNAVIRRAVSAVLHNGKLYVIFPDTPEDIVLKEIAARDDNKKDIKEIVSLIYKVDVFVQPITQVDFDILGIDAKNVVLPLQKSSEMSVESNDVLAESVAAVNVSVQSRTDSSEGNEEKVSGELPLYEDGSHLEDADAPPFDIDEDNSPINIEKENEKVQGLDLDSLKNLFPNNIEIV